MAAIPRGHGKHFPLYSYTMLVVGLEHARMFADGAPTTRSCPTRTTVKARTCASAKAKLDASPSP